MNIILWLLLGALLGLGGSHAHHKVRNLGGYSVARQVGASAVKARLGRAIGIPLTPSGRRRKLGAMIFKMFGL